MKTSWHPHYAPLPAWLPHKDNVYTHKKIESAPTKMEFTPARIESTPSRILIPTGIVMRNPEKFKELIEIQNALLILSIFQGFFSLNVPEVLAMTFRELTYLLQNIVHISMHKCQFKIVFTHPL